LKPDCLRQHTITVRFPMPTAPVTVTIRKRAGSGTTWRDLWTTTVDPKNMFVNTARPEPSPGALIEFERNGDPATKVDLLLLGDGYTAAERRKFEADSRRLLAVHARVAGRRVHAHRRAERASAVDTHRRIDVGGSAR